MALLSAVGQVVIASAIVDPLLERVINATVDEVELIRDVREEMVMLVVKLEVIQSVLADAEAKSGDNNRVGRWLQTLRQVCLDADDIVDEYATASSERTRFVSDSATAHQIREINQRLDDLIKMKAPFGLQVSATGSSRLANMSHRKTTSLLADEKSVIGRDDEKKMVIGRDAEGEHVSANNRSFSVLPIVGMGGVGKTTLARLVFRDEKVVNHFDVKMWVCVSNDFDPERLTKEMIDAASTTSLESMQQTLRRKVEGRTFLLVLDDVWEANRSQWDILLEPLKFAKKGSMIVVTTRNCKDAIKVLGLMNHIALRGLSDDHIWPLFTKYAFDGVRNADGTIGAQYLHLETIGRQIVKRLKGSPLAARTIGSLLNIKLDAQHWNEILNSEMWKLAQEKDDIFPVLRLSYEHLGGDDLKQCFAYCSLFPKDYLFGKEELVQLWSAQCFIRTERDGEKCFDNLLYRSFFEPSPDGDEKYVMHDLIHDLAENVSENDCFRFEYNKKPKEVPETVRHMSVCGVKEFDQAKLKEVCRHEKLRTLLFMERFFPYHGAWNPALDELLLKLKRLRVLGLRRCGIKELPRTVGDLKHLRYIDLSENPELESLPESLGNLHKLQVMNLENCYRLGALPTRMSELTDLRLLQAPPYLFYSIDGIGKLTNLRHLYIRGTKVKEMGGMSMLRELHISRLEEVQTKEEAIRASLYSKEHLRVLTLEWSDGRDATSSSSSMNRQMEEEVFQELRPADTITELSISGYAGVKSPNWWQDPSPFPCLRHLEIVNCPNLSELFSLSPTLQRLSLYGVGVTSLPELWGCRQDGGEGTQTSYSSSSASASLSQLIIMNCPNLRSVSGLLRQRLTDLFLLLIADCEELTTLPERGFGHLVSLHILKILRCPKLSCPSLLHNEGEDEGAPPLPLPRSLRELGIVECGDAMGGWWWAGLEELTSLVHLTLGGCPNTVASLFLSMGMSSLSSLWRLAIRDCPEIRSLPEKGLPSSMRKLEIHGCPSLAEQCRDQQGTEWWSEISDADGIWIDGERIDR